MFNKIKQVKNESGFVSLETIIVTGVVIALGLYGLNQYQEVSKLAIDGSVDKVTEVLSFVTPGV